MSNTTNIWLACSSLLSMLAIFIAIYFFRKQNKKIKLLEENLNATKIAIQPLDYDSDTKWLEKNIEMCFEDLRNKVITPLNSSSYKNQRILDDDRVEEIEVIFITEVKKRLSPNYIKMLENHYFEDLDLYLMTRIDNMLLPYLLGTNIRKFRK